jgi:hypothetical protein
MAVPAHFPSTTTAQEPKHYGVSEDLSGGDHFSSSGVSRPLDRSRPSSGLLVIQEREIAAQDEILQIFYTYTSDGGPE